MNTTPTTPTTTQTLDETPTRYQRSAKPTVQLRRPTCTELAERPDLVAQLVLAEHSRPIYPISAA